MPDRHRTARSRCTQVGGLSRMHRIPARRRGRGPDHGTGSTSSHCSVHSCRCRSRRVERDRRPDRSQPQPRHRSASTSSRTSRRHGRSRTHDVVVLTVRPLRAAGRSLGMLSRPPCLADPESRRLMGGLADGRDVQPRVVGSRQRIACYCQSIACYVTWEGPMTTTTAPPRARPRARALQRSVHVAAGAVLLVSVYAGPLLGAGFAGFVQWAAFPALAVSGVVLWRWPRIRRMLRGRRVPA